LQQTGGSYFEAAKILGIHPNSLLRLMRNLNVKVSMTGGQPSSRDTKSERSYVIADRAASAIASSYFAELLRRISFLAR
jgi:hypothetical protein